MRRFITSIVAVGAVTALLLGSSGPSSASARDSEWFVDPGGEFSAESSEVSLISAVMGVQYLCPSSVAQGGFAEETNENRIGEFHQVSFTGCHTFLGMAFELRMVDEVWNIHAESQVGEVTTGYVDGVRLRMTGAGCDATFEGEVPFTYIDSTDVLTFVPPQSGHELRATSVVENANCFGLITEGDVFEMVGEYVVSPGQDITFQ